MKSKVLFICMTIALVISAITIIMLSVALKDAKKELKSVGPSVNETELRDQLSMCGVEVTTCHQDLKAAWHYYDNLFAAYVDLTNKCGADE